MRVYVCKSNREGDWFLASDELAEVLDFAQAVRLNGNNGAFKVQVREFGGGMNARSATAGKWRITVYEGYDEYQRSEGIGATWTTPPETPMPNDVEEALCHALGICVRRVWTVEEILAREG